MNELQHLTLNLFNLFGLIIFIVLYFRADRKLRKEREFRDRIMSHESFRLDLPGSGDVDAGALNLKGAYAFDEPGHVERLFGTGFEYAGEWSPMGSVVFSKRDPLVATFVLKTDLTDLDADLSRIDGFDLILRPFAKPIHDNALEKGHVRLWLTREAGVTIGQQRDNGGDAAEHGTDDQK